MKINRGFISYSDWPTGKPDNYTGDPQYNPTKQSKILGGFQPILDIGKDVIDTFKPYKSESYIFRDLTQPYKGFINIFKGIGYIFAPPLLSIIEAPPTDITLSWLIYGISNIFKGITQIVTSPILLIKIPLRILITHFSGKPTPFENRPSIQPLLNYDSNVPQEEIWNRCLELHRKFIKSVELNNPTKLNIETEKNLFSKIDLVWGNHGNPSRFAPKEKDVNAYMAFFKSNISKIHPKDAPDNTAKFDMKI